MFVSLSVGTAHTYNPFGFVSKIFLKMLFTYKRI